MIKVGDIVEVDTPTRTKKAKVEIIHGTRIAVHIQNADGLGWNKGLKWYDEEALRKDGDG